MPTFEIQLWNDLTFEVQCSREAIDFMVEILGEHLHYCEEL